MKLFKNNTSRDRLHRLRSTDTLLERTQPEVEFDPRRDVPKHLWKQLEEIATSTSIPEMKSNVGRFFDSLLELSIIDEKIRDLLASRSDLIQHRLNKLPIITHPEKDGVTPGGLEGTADLLQLVPELGSTVRAVEKHELARLSWYTDIQLEDLQDYLYGRTQPATEENDPIGCLLSGLGGSLAFIRLFPGGRTELLEALEKINIPKELATEAQTQLTKGKIELAIRILAFGRMLFPEQADTYKEIIQPYWSELKTRMGRERSLFSGWANTTLGATILTADAVEIDHEGRIRVQLKSRAASPSKPLPERPVA